MQFKRTQQHYDNISNLKDALNFSSFEVLWRLRLVGENSNVVLLNLHPVNGRAVHLWERLTGKTAN